MLCPIRFDNDYSQARSLTNPVVSLVHRTSSFSLATQALSLIDNIDVNLSNESGATPLLLASKYGYILVVQVRLDCTSGENGVNPMLQFVNVHGNHSFQPKHVLHSSSHHFLIIQFPHILTLVPLLRSIDRGVTPSSHHPLSFRTHFAGSFSD